jgi:hypothetical protein
MTVLYFRTLQLPLTDVDLYNWSADHNTTDTNIMVMMVYNALNDTIVSFLTHMYTNVCIKGDTYYAANNYIATNYGLSL